MMDQYSIVVLKKLFASPPVVVVRIFRFWPYMLLIHIVIQKIEFHATLSSFEEFFVRDVTVLDLYCVSVRTVCKLSKGKCLVSG